MTNIRVFFLMFLTLNQYKKVTTSYANHSCWHRCLHVCGICMGGRVSGGKPPARPGDLMTVSHAQYLTMVTAMRGKCMHQFFPMMISQKLLLTIMCLSLKQQVRNAAKELIIACM